MAAAAIGFAGSVAGAASESHAAGEAADVQEKMAKKGIKEQRRQFDATQKLLAPFVEGGNKGHMAELPLAGLSGEEAQQAAIDTIRNGSEYGALVEEGENAITANASITGGLRGGDIQGSMMEFRPRVLSSLINRQLDRFGGITDRGAAAATRTAIAGQNSANSVSQLYANSGEASAAGYLRAGEAQSDMWGDIAIGGADLAGDWQSGKPNGGLF